MSQSKGEIYRSTSSIDRKLRKILIFVLEDAFESDEARNFGSLVIFKHKQHPQGVQTFKAAEAKFPFKIHILRLVHTSKHCTLLVE